MATAPLLSGTLPDGQCGRVQAIRSTETALAMGCPGQSVATAAMEPADERRDDGLALTVPSVAEHVLQWSSPKTGGTTSTVALPTSPW